MRDPREALDRIRKQADNATDGPWKAEGGFVESVSGSQLTIVECSDPEEHDVDNAEFIAAARTTVPALLDALEKVLAMHTPMSRGRVSMCCSCEQWIESSDGHACIEYPCPTVTAITQALTTA